MRDQTTITEAEKGRARLEVSRAVRDGRLTRKPCEHCGSEKNVIAHHDDYDKPLDVMWLCSRDHVLHHQKLGWGARIFAPYPKKFGSQISVKATPQEYQRLKAIKERTQARSVPSVIRRALHLYLEATKPTRNGKGK